MSYSAPSFAYKDNVMTYKYPEMSYETKTANATGFLNGGFPGYSNLLGHGQFPGYSNLLGHGQFPGYGNPFTSSTIPMPYNYEYQYPTEMSYSAPSFAYKDNVMTYKYPEMNYKTETANATGFLNGGFPGHGNLFGYGQFPGNGNLFGYGAYQGYGLS